MKSILITGANGNIGSYLVRHFRAKGYSVVTSSRKRNNVFEWPKEYVKKFYTKHNIGFVLHTAGVVDPKSDADILFNAFSYKNLLVDTSVRYFLFGSVAEYGFQNKRLTEISTEQPETDYGLSKLMQKDSAEYAYKKLGYDIVYMRLSNVLLPHAHTSSLIENIMKEMPKGNRGTISIKNHQIRRDFIDIRDVSAFIELAMQMKKHKNVYNVTSGLQTKYTTLINLFAEHYRKTKHQFPNLIVQGKKESYMRGVYLHTRATRDMGWRPHFTIADTVQWMMHERGLINL